MKNKLYLAILLLLPFMAPAQNKQFQEGDENIFYTAKGTVKFYRINLKEQTISTTPKYVFGSLNFTIIGSDLIFDSSKKKYIAVKFQNIKPEYVTKTTNVKNANNADSSKVEIIPNKYGNVELYKNDSYINSEDNGSWFAIESTEFNDLLTKKINIAKKFNTGWKSRQLITGATLTTPFKLRPKIGDNNYRISPEVSLGPYFGGNIRLDNDDPIFLNCLISAGITSIALNDNVTENPTGQDGLAMGFYLSGGFVFQIDNFQLGALVGADFVSGEQGKNWIYNNHPWISFSVGFNFLGGPTNKATREKEEQSKKDNLLANTTIGEILDRTPATSKVTLTENSVVIEPMIKEALDTLKQQNTIGVKDMPTSSGIEAALVIENASSSLANIIKDEKPKKRQSWIYLGQKINGKFTGTVFDLSTQEPKPGDLIRASSAVFKRTAPPTLINNEWRLGDIVGAVEGEQEVKVIQVKEVRDMNYWALIEKTD